MRYHEIELFQVPVQNFINEKCVTSPYVRISLRTLRESFDNWINSSSDEGLRNWNPSARLFGRILESKGFTRFKANNTHYQGISLRSEVGEAQSA